MLLRKRNSLLLLCLLLACCQKADLTVEPDETGTSEESEAVIGTGEGTRKCPYTVADIRSKELDGSEAVWVIGYMVGTARQAMSHAVFSIDADNQSNILLSGDSLCSDASNCIPVELNTAKLKDNFSLPTNTNHFQKCLLLKGVPLMYLNRKGLRKVSAGLWMDGFDIASIAPTEWGTIEI